MNKKNNQRFQETHQKLQDTLVELSKTQDIRQVTVRALCEHTGINRSTFYAHYLDIDDLIQATGKRMMTDITRFFDDTTDILDHSLTKEYLVQLVIYIREHADFFDVYFNHTPSSATDAGFSLLWESAGRSYAEQFGTLEESEMRYHFSFFKAGFLAVLGQWLQKGCVDPPEKIATIVIRNLPEHRNHA